jgi:hypothetical protein
MLKTVAQHCATTISSIFREFPLIFSEDFWIYFGGGIMKSILSLGALLWGFSAGATELTHGNLPGHYRAEAHVLFKSFYGRIHIIDDQEFEFQRTYANGSSDPTCQGTYTFNSSKVLQGYGTCPDDRQKKLDFRIEFGKASVEELKKGTNVKLQTSLGGGVRVNAFVKKQ